MTKKEITELKKLYAKDAGCITRICGCYVNGEKEQVATFKDAFLSLPDEDVFKYYEIFRKTLSGKIGKNLLTLAFPLEAETGDGQQKFLLQLRDSGLKDDALLDAFYNMVIENYDQAEHYLILLIHNVYDIPGKTKDGFMIEDASDEVYSYLLCSICPVKLSKPGLSYNQEEQTFQNRSRDWLVDAPETGFLFPAFTDRSMDIHNMLLFAKKPDGIQPDFVMQMFGCPVPTPSQMQQELFEDLIKGSAGEELSYETIVNIHETICEHAEMDESIALDKTVLGEVFTENGIDREQFEQAFDDVIPEDTTFMAANVVTPGKVEVKAQGITVQAKPEYGHLLETRKVDGRNCLVIALEGDVMVNGISLL